MKCLCGFTQKPDNVRILKAHLEDCLSTGALKDMFPLPVVVWRGSLQVVKELDVDEAALELGITIDRAPAQKQKVHKKLVDKETRVANIVQEMEDAEPEEIIEAVEAVVQEEEKPAPKKKAPAKKKSSTTKK